MENDFLDSFELSGSITTDGQSFSGTLAPGETVWISIDYVAGQIIDLDARGSIRIYDAEGNVVDQSQSFRSSGAVGNANLFLEGLESGTYFIAVSWVPQQFDGAFNVSATTITDDFGDGLTDATAIQADGSTITGSIDYQGDADTFVIDARLGQTLDFSLAQTVSGMGTSNGTIRLRDADGNVILTSTGRETRFGDFSYTPTQTGPITVEVTYGTTSFTVAQTTNYSFTVTEQTVNLVDGTQGSDTLRGTRGEDDIAGFGGDDVLLGFGGDDKLFAGDGADTLRGGSGDDDMFGGNGADEMFGGSGNDYVEGGNGADTMRGNNGADVMEGGAGHDFMLGGDGSDVVNGGDGNDRLLGQNGDDFMNGGDGDDYMNGGAQDDRMSGSGGNDRMIGGSGNDDMTGGLGDDVMSGGSGGDLVSGGLGHDRLFGNSGDDILTGSWGNDRLHGGDGDDIISGGRENDILSGGQGADTFVFDYQDGSNMIRDFDGSEDSIVIRQTVAVNDFDELMDFAYQDGDDLVLENDFGLRIRIEDMHIDDFTADMVEIVYSVYDYLSF